MDTRGLFKTYQTSLLEPFAKRLKVCGGRSEEALECVEKVFVAYFDSDGNVLLCSIRAFILPISKHIFKTKSLRLSVSKEKKRTVPLQ